MEIKLPWGKETLRIDVPDTWTLVYPESMGGKVPGGGGEAGIVASALKKPIGMQPISAHRLKGKKAVIIVDDNTRPTPAHRFLHLVLGELSKAGAGSRNTLLIPALGIHTTMTETEMVQKVGAKNLQRLAWENHNAFDREKNHFFGTTSRGTPVWLNRHLADAGLIVLVGMVEPHLWAGFGGGLKNILPGAAYAETIGVHHAIIAEPPYLFNRVGMMPEQNSFRRDLEEIKRMIPAPIFCVNVVLNHRQEIAAAFAGDPIECHRAAVDFNLRISGKRIGGRADAVITNSYPMDINFKQGMKCVGNILPAVKPGGSVIAFMRAERGIDDIIPPEKSTPLWLAKAVLRTIGPSRVLGFLEKTRKGLNVEEKFLLYYSMQLMRQNDLYFYAPALSNEEKKRLGFFVSADDPQEIIDIAAKKIGRHARVAVFPEGGASFPVVI